MTEKIICSERVINRLREITQDLSGYPIEDLGVNTSFLELGFDSLFLTQLATVYQKEFGVRVTFRQLFDELPTMEAIGAYIDANQPAGEPAKLPEAVDRIPALMTEEPPNLPLHAQPSQSSSVTPAPETTRLDQKPVTGLESVFIQQLDLMAEQLRILQGTPAAARPLHVARASVAEPHEVISSTAAVTDAKSDTKSEAPKIKLPAGFGPGATGSSELPPLPPIQQQHLDALIERYTRKTAGSKERTQRYRRTLADPRTAAGFNRRWKEMVYPIWVERSFGSKLWDVDGNEYIDILNGFGPNFLGHSPSFITEILQEQLRRGVEIGPQTVLVGEVSEMICQLTGMDRVSFACTGSEAVQAAKRIARTVTGRDKVVVFSGDYHGNFDQVLVREVNRGDKLRTLPLAPGIPFQSVNDTYVLKYGAEESLDIIMQRRDEIAAVLVEPIQSRRPEFQPRDFIQKLRQITAEAGIVLVFDEVITGFRVEPGGAQAYYGIEADLATYGKVIGGGMPIGVVAGRARFMDTFDGGYWQYGDDSFPEAGVTFFAGTFVRHPLSIAAAHATLKHLISEGPALQQRVNEKTTRFAKEINDLFQKHEIEIEVPHFSSQMYIRVKEQAELATLLFYHLRDKGVHVLEGFPSYITDAHSEDDLRYLIKAFTESVEDMVEVGIFGRQVRSGASAIPRQFPLTVGQREIWFSSQINDEAACSYNESDTLHLRGPLDEEKLRLAVKLVLERHQSFHLRFSSEGDHQYIDPDSRIEVSLLDLSGFSEGERQKHVDDLLSHEASTPFDLINGPLSRVTLVRRKETDHLLVLYANHLVFDGWSSGVVFDEIGRVYSASDPSKAIEALPKPMPFSDYAALEAVAEASGERGKARAHWLSQFDQLPPALDLPCDRTRPVIRTFSGSTIKWKLRDSVYRDIKRVAAKQNTSLFALLLAAYKVFLSRLSGQDDIVIGISVAGQAMVEGDAIVGHGVNLLPLRVQIDGSIPFSELSKQTKAEVMDFYEYHQCTLGDILSKLNVPRDPSRAPLIETMFNFSTKVGDLHYEGVEVTIGENPRHHVNFDLFANILEGDGCLTADWDYNTDLFEEDTVRRWVKHFETMLESIAADPGQSLNELDLLSESEKVQLVHEWNDTNRDYPRQYCIHHLFEKQADVNPLAIAVQLALADERPGITLKELSYTALEMRSNRLSNHLKGMGVGPETLVAICVERSCNTLVGLLGILKAGGAYVPLDPDYPMERLAYMLEDSGARIIVTDNVAAGCLPAGDYQIVNLSDEAQLAGASSKRASADVGSDNLAYVIYTSGSTGKPKGVQVHHGAVVNFLISMAQEPGFSANDSLLAVTTLSFDIAGLELFLPLSVGARCIIADQATTLDGRELLAAIKEMGATVMQATPASWRLLIEAGWTIETPLKVMCGGEALPVDLAAALTARSSDVWNMYGPTETTIWSTCDRIRSGDKIITAGRPIANTQVYILDALKRPVPIGVAGELYIGGDGVARGYLGRPELTAERFMEDAFSRDPGARMYRTGDLARFLSDKRIQCLARMDQQVKIRGFRVELGEIEAALAKLPWVRQSVVSVWDAGSGDHRLVAYLLLGEGKVMDLSGAREHLQRILPDYMMPQHFVALDKIPMTLNGKVDRRALPTPEKTTLVMTDNYQEPTTAIEKSLADLWSEVLKLDRVGIKDNFFDMGGHSLLAARMLSRARKKFDVELTIRGFFAEPTIQGLGEYIEAQLYVMKDNHAESEDMEKIEL